MRALPYLKRVARDTWTHTRRAQLPLVASSLSYTTILSLIPLLAVSFAIFQLFGGLEKIYDVMEPFVLDNLVEGVSDQVIDLLRTFINNAHAKTLGLGGLIGLVFTSVAMLQSIERAINGVWNAPLRRSFLWRLTSYGLIIILGPFAMAVALGLATSRDFPIGRFFHGGAGFFFITVSFLFLTYKCVPHTLVYKRYALVSAVMASIAFSIARVGYAAYMARAVSYSKIYGSLAAVPILLLWIYIVWMIILAGAALTSALQKYADQEKSQA
jgi:membrane protein